MNTHKHPQPTAKKTLKMNTPLYKKLSKSWTIDFQLKAEQIQEAIKAHQDLYYSISTFEFNIFEFAEMVGRNM